jgi:hypothetical protein
VHWILGKNSIGQIRRIDLDVEELNAYQADLVNKFISAKDAYSEAKEMQDIAEEAFRKAEQQLWEHIEALGLSAVKRKEGSFTKSSQQYPKKPSGQDLDLFREWAESVGKKADLFTEEVRTTEFNALIKGMLSDSGELPPGVETPTVRKYITFRRK